MTKEKDKSFNNFVNKDEKDEEFNFEDEDITNQGFVNHESSIRDIPEEDKVTILTEEDLGLGERIDIEEILDKDILIKGIKTRPSSFYEGDYAIIQVEKDGKLYVVTTSSSVLMDQINKIESKIPFRCRITKRKNPATNRRYYIIVPIR